MPRELHQSLVDRRSSVPTATPEHAIANADMVFALGRSALEGMAAGRAVYVYGAVGGDGWVTPDRYPAMEADGFAGLSDRGMTIDAARLTADLAEWKQLMGEVNRDLVLSNHEAREHAIELVSLRPNRSRLGSRFQVRRRTSSPIWSGASDKRTRGVSGPLPKPAS